MRVEHKVVCGSFIHHILYEVIKVLEERKQYLIRKAKRVVFTVILVFVPLATAAYQYVKYGRNPLKCVTIFICFYALFMAGSGLLRIGRNKKG